jgi:hypothetical protein
MLRKIPRSDEGPKLFSRLYCHSGGITSCPWPAFISISYRAIINGEINMQTVIRTYSGKGAKELFDVLEQRKTELATVMRPIKGFVSYTAARSSDGGFTVTVCQDKAGVHESVAKAKDWITKNAPSTGAAAPTLLEGSVIVQA